MNKACRSVGVWCISLSNGDWFYVFANSGSQALRIVIGTHYATMRTRDFREACKPTIRRVPDREIVLVNDGDQQQAWTAKKWAKDEQPGPFISNTYEQ